MSRKHSLSGSYKNNLCSLLYLVTQSHKYSRELENSIYMYVPCNVGNIQVQHLASVQASVAVVVAAAAVVVAASVENDVQSRMVLADLGSGFLAAGETAVLSLFAACAAFGHAAVLGVHAL